MYRTLMLSTFLSAALLGASVEFIEAPEIGKRVMPNSATEILSFHDAIKNTTGAIVHIATTQDSVDQAVEQINPFFEQFFGQQFRFKREPKKHALGSGVIISKDGYILTNNHVVENASKIVVTLPENDKEYEAQVIGLDPKSDLAVIKIDAKELRPITMGSSKNLKVGDVVFAIGNPFGVGQSVTQGIISAQHKNSVGINEYENFIQTDASINPGNSGGALVDSRGALIGINSAIITRSGGNNGIGFAIEVDMAKDIAKRLIENGTVERGYLGVSIGNLSAELKDLYDNEEGAILLDVTKGTPADKAGLMRGDLIIKIDDQKIKNASELKNTIGMYQPGSKATITFERNKKIRTATVKLENAELSDGASQLLEGVSLEALDDNTRYRYRIPGNVEGVLITRVKPGSKAATQGLQEGDIIVQIEDTLISDLATLRQALPSYTQKHKRIYIYREGRIFVAVLK
ncbi:MAG: Do family serine endopeptidase [Campylobacterales bacterium]|nr:Do family serine endopeptidase [Campylobacterales bacterium]